MHTHEGKKANIFHNGDYSGEAIVIDRKTGTEVRIDCADLLGFAAEFVRTERMRSIEDATTEQLLGVKVPR